MSYIYIYTHFFIFHWSFFSRHWIWFLFGAQDSQEFELSILAHLLCRSLYRKRPGRSQDLNQKSSSVTWTVRSVKTRSACGLLKRHTLQSCQKMRMKLKFRATARMGFHSQHRLDVEGPEASMVNFYGLLEVKMFFFPEMEHTQKRCFGKWFLLQIWLFYVC